VTNRSARPSGSGNVQREKTRYPQLIIADVNLPEYGYPHPDRSATRGMKIPFILLASGPTRVSAKLVRLLHRACSSLCRCAGRILSALYALLYEAGDLASERLCTVALPVCARALDAHQLIEKRVSRDQN